MDRRHRGRYEQDERSTDLRLPIKSHGSASYLPVFPDHGTNQRLISGAHLLQQAQSEEDSRPQGTYPHYVHHHSRSTRDQADRRRSKRKLERVERAIARQESYARPLQCVITSYGIQNGSLDDLQSVIFDVTDVKMSSGFLQPSTRTGRSNRIKQDVWREKGNTETFEAMYSAAKDMMADPTGNGTEGVVSIAFRDLEGRQASVVFADELGFRLGQDGYGVKIIHRDCTHPIPEWKSTDKRQRQLQGQTQRFNIKNLNSANANFKKTTPGNSDSRDIDSENLNQMDAKWVTLSRRPESKRGESEFDGEEDSDRDDSYSNGDSHSVGGGVLLDPLDPASFSTGWQ